jgi:hypothetical protein
MRGKRTSKESVDLSEITKRGEVEDNTDDRCGCCQKQPVENWSIVTPDAAVL